MEGFFDAVTNGNVKVPFVPFGTENFNVYSSFSFTQEAWNFPSEVVNPASACCRSANCGARFHV
jgi:hypothetical protein